MDFVNKIYELWCRLNLKLSFRKKKMFPELKAGPDMEEVKRFFVEASLNTYAADAPKTAIEALPKSKAFYYERGSFLYIDLYFSSGKKRCGQAIIWYKGEPVGGMSYQGFWEGKDESIIPFLKRALRSSYQNGEFVGGRGPESYNEGALEYRNRLWREKFEDFNGDEEIWQGAKLVFHRHYEGMALI